jgi:hypothetical protein
LKRVNFAIRAHKSAGGKGWHKKVNEEDLLQNVPMFPIGQNTPVVGQNIVSPGNTQSTVGNQTPNPSTTKPLTPADKRNQQQQQTSQQQVAQQPVVGTPMVPPTENSNIKRQPTPSNTPVKKTFVPPGKIVQQ